MSAGKLRALGFVRTSTVQQPCPADRYASSRPYFCDFYRRPFASSRYEHADGRTLFLRRGESIFGAFKPRTYLVTTQVWHGRDLRMGRHLLFDLREVTWRRGAPPAARIDVTFPRAEWKDAPLPATLGGRPVVVDGELVRVEGLQGNFVGDSHVSSGPGREWAIDFDTLNPDGRETEAHFGWVQLEAGGAFITATHLGGVDGPIETQRSVDERPRTTEALWGMLVAPEIAVGTHKVRGYGGWGGACAEQTTITFGTARLAACTAGAVGCSTYLKRVSIPVEVEGEALDVAYESDVVSPSGSRMEDGTRRFVGAKRNGEPVTLLLEPSGRVWQLKVGTATYGSDDRSPRDPALCRSGR